MPRIPARAIALITSAALLASLAVATTAAPASAAKPKPRCQGKVATIVGTRGNDILRGTARRDVIVAKGGNDRIYAKGGNDLVCAGPGNDRVFGGPGADVIWGQLGNDRLSGNAGPDFMAGQVGNDTLNGGIGVDTCYQGTGTGHVSNCELPASVFAPPPPPPDTDGDGVVDSGDSCPNKGGIVGANGCPLDTDGDGVVDNVDACPNEGDEGYGLMDDGCPIKDYCTHLNDPTLDGTYISHGPVTLRFKGDEGAQWSATGPFDWRAANIAYDDGTTESNLELRAGGVLFNGLGPKPGMRDLSWETVSGEPETWTVTCTP